ncbi:MAG: hypothetical protein ABF904_07540 [Ethanoligenens sp.]
MTNTSRGRIHAEMLRVLLSSDHRGESKFAKKKELKDKVDALKKEHPEEKVPMEHVKGLYAHCSVDNYLKEALLFLKFADSKNGDEKHLPNLRKYAGAYIQDCKDRDLSAPTIYKRATVLGTLFHCHATNFGVALPKRERKDIKRTRSVPASIGTRYTEGEKYKPIRDFIIATGCRRSELIKLKFESLYKDKNGSLVMKIKGKGGKVRESPVFPGMEDIVRQALAQSSGYGNKGEHVFPKNWVPTKMAVHQYRAKYAQNLYDRYLSQGLGIGEPGNVKKIYYCRKERTGQAYYKNILLLVSEALGHGRWDVVVNNYFYADWKPCIPFDSTPAQK